MSPHRTPGEVEPDLPAPLPKGPATKCKGCSARRTLACRDGHARRDDVASTYTIVGYHSESPLVAPRACTPLARVKTGWFARCREPGEHLHERCKVCGLEWMTSFAEGGAR